MNFSCIATGLDEIRWNSVCKEIVTFLEIGRTKPSGNTSIMKSVPKMDLGHHSAGVTRFADFEVDFDLRELRKGAEKIALQEQPFQVLAVLLAHAGQLVRREELRAQVWPKDTFVEFDQALNTAIKKIRIALDDDADAPVFIQTIPRRGYRFVSPVSYVSGTHTDVVKNEVGKRPWSKIALVATGLGLMVLLGFQAIRRVTPAEGYSRKRVVVAVLPFENWSDDAGRVHVCQGITQELITELGRLDPERVEVAARAKVQPYAGSTRPMSQIGNELHADYLMGGNLRTDGVRVRVSAELVRVSDQTRVWGDEFDRQDGNLLVLESEIAKSIVTSIKEKVVSVPSQ